jgi:hypothetical protein
MSNIATRDLHTDPEIPNNNLDPTLYELSKSDSSRFQTIKRVVWDEMIRRYADKKDGPNELKKLDNGMLHRLFVEVTKVDFALGKQQAPESKEDRGASIMDIINNPGLAPERRAEILESAKAKLRADLDLLEEIEEAVVDDMAALSQ